jgi:HSP20 family molecular chaperone IbpA
MSEKTKPAEGEKSSKKGEIAITKRKPLAIRPSKKNALENSSQADLWQAFDDTFSRFRTDFEDLLFPGNWVNAFSIIPETRVPAVDLEDKEKEYILKAEMPGFKKEDIEIEVQEDSIAITGNAGWKYDEKGQLYICKERACKTFYRRLDLPEQIKTDQVNANLAEGVLEITLPKKAPKQKRKVTIK